MVRWAVLVVLMVGCGHEPAPPPTPAPVPLPEPRSLDEACARWKCRPDTQVRLEMPTGWYEITVGRTVYVDGKILRVVAGETLAITGDVQGDQLVNLRLAEPAPETNVLLFHLEQKKLKNGPTMILKVENRFPRNVKYRASMQVPERKGFRTTSSCAVMSGKFVYEMWPHAIISVLIKDLRFVEGRVACD
jgi:hypothetical protein